MRRLCGCITTCVAMEDRAVPAFVASYAGKPRTGARYDLPDTSTAAYVDGKDFFESPKSSAR